MRHKSFYYNVFMRTQCYEYFVRYLFVFSMQQHICRGALYATTCLSTCLSHSWISQKWL